MLSNLLQLSLKDKLFIVEPVPSIIDGLDYETFSYYFDQLMLTQDSLNQDLCGPNYTRTLITDKTNRKIRFGNALISEANELLDSTSWKHWKNVSDSDMDMDNIATELIDFLHFLPSLLLVNLKVDSNDDTEILIENSPRYINHKVIAWNRLNVPVGKIDDTSLITTTLSVNNLIGSMCNLSHIYNPDVNDIGNDDFKYGSSYIIAFAFGLTYSLHIELFNSTVESIWSEYIVKNTLNRFRANNGYKDGTYIKLWERDVEDNVIAKAIMCENPEFTGELLYKELEEEYARVLDRKVTDA